jgi:hypothetical protein
MADDNSNRGLRNRALGSEISRNWRTPREAWENTARLYRRAYHQGNPRELIGSGGSGAGVNDDYRRLFSRDFRDWNLRRNRRNNRRASR